MDGLTYQISTGSKSALALAKTLITTPTLINLDSTQGAVYAIPLDVETNQKEGSSEVSENLVISTDKKQNIADNIAPASKTWTLTGYIRGIPYLEPVSYFQPFVKLHTDILWNWRDNGAVLIYRDSNSQIYKKVVIKNLKTMQQKDCANATPFSMTLKEINLMETSLSDLSDLQTNSWDRIKKSLATIGSALGTPITIGMTAAESVEEDS